MNLNLLVIGILLLIVSYLVGVLKQTWLLAGFNEKAIRDKARLGRVVGGVFLLPLGMVFIVHSFIAYPYDQWVLVFTMIILLLSVSLYINQKLFEE
ncbi:DUF3784 domain-containing protein [Guptibacillus hwajinpoensis]|uniref:DUF3784 domain-containing protein n=1 Tax=Guptibacillus hwajinpoensis TaxID=208199 RepID=UPI001CFF2D99|nr:DUF3784 domain-containing protein [Pseudalkalibacillus hwajinpoensis]WLR58897.1 DUF3784 domain-containing protein [Pseudalkalibacillus hwajinpoensis]